jgi:heme A synthase
VSRLARFAWIVLAYNIAVILWGAYVRATGSGAGCGSHWPLCNGQVVPRAPSVETLIEFSHRLTSGIALLAVVGLLVWTWRRCPAGHPARRGAALSMAFMLAEAAVGAGLVLFQLVADNASLARALFMAVHLVNTFALVACLTLTAHWLSGGAPVRPAERPATAAGLALLGAGLLLVGTSGAVAALGDTLYPASSLADGLRADLSPTSHLLVRLRVLHPALAIGASVALAVLAPRCARPAGGRRARLAARAVVLLAAVQIAAGFVNVMLLAPVWMQMLHLLLADALWIAFVLLAASALAGERAADALAARAGALAPAPAGRMAPE